MMKIKGFLSGTLLCLAANTLLPTAANAYQIDCAIMICLPGGFPTSSECTRAKIEVMRRIMPLPEPPLQIWRCPMNLAASIPGADRNGVTPYVRDYIGGIEVWEIFKRSTNSSGGRESTVTAMRNYYSSINRFQRISVNRRDVPAWVNSALRQNTGMYDLTDDYGSFRGILFRYGDADGNMLTEWVPY